jgi:glycerophosphoryl diester phosphodiesterase
MALSKKQIFAHRGLWLESGLEKNSMGAFQLAFEEGFGVEEIGRASCRERV